MSGAGAVPVGAGIEPPSLRKSGWAPMKFTQLNMLALILVFAFSGLVSLADMAFVILSSVYILIMCSLVFPSRSSAVPPPVFSRSRLFVAYVWTGAALGIFLPLAYIFGGVVYGHKGGVRAAAPHVFLLSCQVFWEAITFNSPRFSLPARAFVPVFYNTKRIFTILEWLKMEFGDPVAAEEGGEWWQRNFGRALAVANLGFWGFNLFCFLLPVYLPKAFRKYYEEELKTSREGKNE